MSERIGITVNGQPLGADYVAIKRDGVVYAPLRGLMTAIGATVDWQPQDSRVTLALKDVTIDLHADSKETAVNGKAASMSTPPLMVAGTLYVPVRWINEQFGAVVKWNGASSTVAVYYAHGELAAVQSAEHLKELLALASESSSGLYGNKMLAMRASAETSAPAAESAVMDSGASVSGGDYSGTNVQVQGVDEADVVKTDGRYLYQVVDGKVVIARAVPAGQMSIAATIAYDGQFYPTELYIDEGRLIVIGTQHTYADTPYNDGREIGAADGAADGAASKRMLIYPYPASIQTTKALVYDVSDISAPQLERELEIEGGYVSSRKIGSSLYLIANKYFDYYTILRQESDIIAPQYRDSLYQKELAPLDYSDIRYFPGAVEPNYLLVGGINLDQPGSAMSVNAYLGSGQTIYASEQHLYVAVTQYDQRPMPLAEGSAAGDGQTGDAGDAAGDSSASDGAPAVSADIMPVRVPVQMQSKTAVHKFALADGETIYIGQGEVPGTILNQFSMDEYNGYFRIATTTGEMWRTDEFTSKNNVYVLDPSLAVTGKIEDIAPGERIYSVRYMGAKAYMVTFRTVDPLFVLDLADPAKPAVLGELKIPGYSDYLHPYDENHIIGFGKDAVEVRGNAFQLGMKVALFDVSDVTAPKELHSMYIGDRGTHSELLYNHRALLFSKEKSLLAFPVELYELKGTRSQGLRSATGDATGAAAEVDGGAAPGAGDSGAATGGGASAAAVGPVWRNVPDYGQFTFQGAYIFHVDPVSGFTLQGRITHLSDDELKRAPDHWYDYSKTVRRIVYIGDTLYTLSNYEIQAHGMNDLAKTGSLLLPK